MLSFGRLLAGPTPWQGDRFEKSISSKSECDPSAKRLEEPAVASPAQRRAHSSGALKSAVAVSPISCQVARTWRSCTGNALMILVWQHW